MIILPSSHEIYEDTSLFDQDLLHNQLTNSFDMASKIKEIRQNVTHSHEAEIARAEAPELEKVNWSRDKGLRKLYFFAAVICIASATTGYDGSVHQLDSNDD